MYLYLNLVSYRMIGREARLLRGYLDPLQDSVHAQTEEYAVENITQEDLSSPSA